MRYRAKTLLPTLAGFCLAAAAASAAASCNSRSDEPPQKPATTPAPESPGIAGKSTPALELDVRSLRPDKALIVVRDIATWWQDCGCSGSAIGGVGRFRAGAGSAREVSFMFVGRTVLPYRDGLSKDRQDALAAAAPWYAGSALAVFEALGNVYWFPDEAERQFLREEPGSPLGEYVVATDQDPTWAGLKVVVTGEWLAVKGNSGRLELPPKGDRARHIVVLAVWNQGAEGSPTFVERMGTVAPIAHRSGMAKAEALRLLDAHSMPIWTWWRQQVTADLEVDPAVDRVAGTTLLGPVHASPGEAYVPGRLNDETIGQQQQACGRCHQAQFSRWAESRHAESMVTLRARMKHQDPRCLPCHAQRFIGSRDGGHVVPGCNAVTCSSCHQFGRKPADTCTACHTYITDPHGNYKLQLSGICARGIPEHSKVACERQDQP